MRILYGVSGEGFGHSSYHEVSGGRDGNKEGGEDNGGPENQFLEAAAGMVGHGGKRGAAEAGTFGLKQNQGGH